MEKPSTHVMLVTFAAQGLINPLLQLAKALASRGLLVTFAATESASKRMRGISDTSSNGGLQFRFFFDDFSLDGDHGNLDTYLIRLKAIGSASLTKLIQDLDATTSVSCIITNPFTPWVVDVAGKLNVPCSLFWPQPYAVFAIYFRHFCNQSVLASLELKSNDHKLEFPGLPTLTYKDLPTYLLPTNPYTDLGEALAETFCRLNKVKCILVNSFQDLEDEVIRSNSDLPHIKMVGPLTRVHRGVAGDLSGDMWCAAECLKWLDTQPASNVLYVSFGSYVVQSPEQMDEIAWGLLRSGQPFLWVVKPPVNADAAAVWRPSEELTKKLDGQGMVVQWAPQAEVLLHPSIGCFMSHCGWNSTLESIMAGVPVIAFPNRGDQTTNAMLLSEDYRMGVVVQRRLGELVGREEVERSIHEAMHGLRQEEMKGNALRWREAGRQAASDGGSSAKNLQAFVEEIKGLLNDP